MPKVYRFNNRTPAPPLQLPETSMRFVASKPHGNNQEFRNTAHHNYRHKGEFSPGTSDKPLTRSKSCANTGLVRNIAPTAAARKEHRRST